MSAKAKKTWDAETWIELRQFRASSIELTRAEAEKSCGVTLSHNNHIPYENGTHYHEESSEPRVHEGNKVNILLFRAPLLGW